MDDWYKDIIQVWVPTTRLRFVGGRLQQFHALGEQNPSRKAWKCPRCDEVTPASFSDDQRETAALIFGKEIAGEVGTLKMHACPKHPGEWKYVPSEPAERRPDPETEGR